MMTRDQYEAVVKLNDVIAEQRIKIEQQAKEIAELTVQRNKLSGELANSKAWKGDWELEVVEHNKSKQENKTLWEALQTCQSRLGCGCGDILCATCSAAYDVAEQALKGSSS